VQILKSSKLNISNTDSESGYDSDLRKSFDDYKLDTSQNDSINKKMNDKNEDQLRDQNETFNIDSYFGFNRNDNQI